MAPQLIKTSIREQPIHIIGKNNHPLINATPIRSMEITTVIKRISSIFAILRGQALMTRISQHYIMFNPLRTIPPFT
jgi:hypothetical protein